MESNPAVLQKVSDLLVRYLAGNDDRDERVVTLRQPADIVSVFGESGTPLEIEDGQEPVSEEVLLKACETTLNYSIRTGHVNFYNQLFARVDEAALAGEWLSAAAQTSMYTFEMAPVFLLVEQACLRKLAKYVGPGFEPSEGLFTPGGSIANLYAVLLARHRAIPDIKTKGLQGRNGPPLVGFTSAQSHYSLNKAFVIAGLGMDSLIKVPCDAMGAMDVDALKTAIADQIAAGNRPFFVNATAGTTVAGAFDPFREIKAVAEANDMWMHVDGCWGASVLLSPTHRGIADGADLADSIAWNPHKLMGVPLQCCVFLTKHLGALKAANSQNAVYLFQPDKENANLDTGDWTVQCGRKVDAFKLWCAFKSHGDAGFARRIDTVMDNAKYFESRICESQAGDGAFVLAYPRTFTNVCFWYVPPALRPFKYDTASPEHIAKVSLVAPLLKRRMQQTGKAMIGFQPRPGTQGASVNCFRIVFVSTSVTQADLDALLNTIAELGKDITEADLA